MLASPRVLHPPKKSSPPMLGHIFLAALLHSVLSDTGEPACEAAQETPLVNVAANIDVIFHNNYAHQLSLNWANANGYSSVITLAVEPGQTAPITTQVGHRFYFSRPGTLARIGPVFLIEEGKNQYELPSDALSQEEMDGPCHDRDLMCERGKANGDCESTPGWMILNCPKSCGFCHLIEKSHRCLRSTLNISQDTWMKNGDLDKLFETMPERGSAFAPTIVSRPPDGPWILTFDNFLTDEEVDAFIKWGHHYGFTRSGDIGNEVSRGQRSVTISQRRTSQNAWCFKECEADPIVDRVTKRVEDLIQHPRSHFENYQLLRYEPGQYYKVHHDMTVSEEHKTMGPGPRTLTVFLYLSDVEEGGATRFPGLNIDVPPKKGKMLVWPSVMSDDQFAQDGRTFHEALPVIQGLKFGSNLWIHTHDFRTSNAYACSAT